MANACSTVDTHVGARRCSVGKMRKRVEVTIAPATAQMALQMAAIVLSGEAKVTDNWNLEVLYSIRNKRSKWGVQRN